MRKRQNFLLKTKRILAQRAAYRCSFPECDALTVGPGTAPDERLLLGDAAHIYSASSNGPRGQGNLSVDQLQAPQNGIWLCTPHHRIVDPQSGRDFPPSILLSYKHLHESKIAREIGQPVCPFGWVEEIEILDSPIVQTPLKIRFGKATIFIGENGSGKTTVSRYLEGASLPEAMSEWLQPSLATQQHAYKLVYRRPEPHSLEVCLEGGRITYRLDGLEVPFNPLPIGIVRLPQAALKGMGPFVRDLANVFDLRPTLMRQTLNSLSIELPTLIQKVRVADDDHIEVSKDGVKFRAFETLSGGEQKMFLLECGIALAQFSAGYHTTLLILDDGLHGLDQRHRGRYLNRLNAPGNLFQTVLIDVGIMPDIAWGGWQYVDFESKDELLVRTKDLSKLPSSKSFKQL